LSLLFPRFQLIFSLGFLYLYWIHLSHPALSSFFLSAVWILWAQLVIYLYPAWIHSVACTPLISSITLVIVSLNFLFDISSYSLLFKLFLLQLLTFERELLPCCFLFLHCDLFISGHSCLEVPIPCVHFLGIDQRLFRDRGMAWVQSACLERAMFWFELPVLPIKQQQQQKEIT
jgi:hypothetical protein